MKAVKRWGAASIIDQYSEFLIALNYIRVNCDVNIIRV
jgi:hypothetical protein